MNDKIRAILEKINEEPVQDAVKIEPTKVATSVIETEAKPTLEVHEAKNIKTETIAPVSEKKAKTEKKALNTEGVKGASISEGFLANVVNEAFSYEKRKYAFIEPRLFEILMQVKIKKDIKNISAIVNSILNEYVEKHQDEIRKLLQNKF
jgi:hypothetical protein